jgi:hypothetical protein
MLKKADTIRRRLAHDYGRRDYFEAYRQLLLTARSTGYEILPLSCFFERTSAIADPLTSGKPLLVLRHDIDTDPKSSLRFAAIESELSIKSTYYFRLRTFDASIIRYLAERGMDIGYHYEELATLAKHSGTRSAEQAVDLVPAAREAFENNLASFRAASNCPVRHASSHGDFANRVIGLGNGLLLNDTGIRRRSDVAFEAYDKVIEGSLSDRLADNVGALDLSCKASAALADGRSPILLLTHPRQWKSAPVVNAQADFLRVREGIAYRARATLRTRASGALRWRYGARG